MKQLFKDNFTIEQIKEIYSCWDNEGILYCWENGEPSEVQILLEKHGYNTDSITVMRNAFETLDLLIWEEKEMKKYAKITKYYPGLIDTDKENGLEIGKEYEIVKFSSVSEDCWVYLNDKRPNYFISETQYEVVEKEEAPTLKANVNVDVKEFIQAKIDSLTTEAEHLFTKRDRLEQHAINMNAKARKLEEVLETIKEFE